MGSDEKPKSERLECRFPSTAIAVVKAALNLPPSTPEETPAFNAGEAIERILGVVPFLVAAIYAQASDEAWQEFHVRLGEAVDRMWEICDSADPKAALDAVIKAQFDNIVAKAISDVKDTYHQKPATPTTKTTVH